MDGQHDHPPREKGYLRVVSRGGDLAWWVKAPVEAWAPFRNRGGQKSIQGLMLVGLNYLVSRLNLLLKLSR